MYFKAGPVPTTDGGIPPGLPQLKKHAGPLGIHGMDAQTLP